MHEDADAALTHDGRGSAGPGAGALMAGPGCSLKTYAINMVGDALASGDSVYETDDDLELVGAALPFGLKLTESLLAQSPNHRGLLLTACRGFVLYSYAFVDYAGAIAADDDLDRARELRARARRLYLPGTSIRDSGARALVSRHSAAICIMTRVAAVRRDHGRRAGPRTSAFLYWTAASLGLAISASPEMPRCSHGCRRFTALLDRALELDEAGTKARCTSSRWCWPARRRARRYVPLIRRHYDRASPCRAGRARAPTSRTRKPSSVPIRTPPSSKRTDPARPRRRP